MGLCRSLDIAALTSLKKTPMAVRLSSVPRTPSSPSATERRARADAIDVNRQRRFEEGQRRAVATQARELAETAPRPSKRGRPRREDDGAALYSMSVRFTAVERTRIRAAAAAARLSLADYLRLQVLGETLRVAEPIVIEIPSRFDQPTIAAFRSISENLNRGIKIIHAQQRRGESAAIPDQLIADLTRLINDFVLVEDSSGSAIGKAVGSVWRAVRGKTEI